MESTLQTLAQAQARQGADVRVLCVNHQGLHGRDVTWQGWRATQTVEEWDGPVRVTRVGRLAGVARFEICPELPLLLSSLHAGRIDVLHLHVPNPTMLVPLAAVGLRVPLVVTYHSDVVRQRALSLAMRPFEHRVFQQAARLLATSPAYPDGSCLLRHYKDKVLILPFGINLAPYLEPDDKAADHARRLSRELGNPLWLAVGRLVYYKGLHNAVLALAEVPGRLLIVGDGPLGSELRQLALATGVADRLVWRDYLDEAELIGAYHAATALWFPSNARSEAFGMVQVEAMACGCPVINTAIPASGVSWVSRHEETGLTVPMNDPAILARAARRLLEEPGLRERLAHRGRERAQREFDDQLMARRSLHIYERVLRRQAGQKKRRPIDTAEVPVR